MKPALRAMMEKRPAIKAAVLGTRMGDPGAKGQGHFSPTDADWPPVMRVNPVLNWSYSHIWSFIRGLCLPYPALYDRGYTSLGCSRTTEPNEALKYEDERTGEVRFRPAYELNDATVERQGRSKRKGSR